MALRVLDVNKMLTTKPAPPHFRERVGRRIRGRRISADLSQAKLGQRLNIDSTQIARWERGDAFPNYRHVCELAAAFGITEEQLIAESS